MLQESGIKEISAMHEELYSRDFTCNTVLMSLDLKRILDPTGLAINDIQSKIIKTSGEMFSIIWPRSIIVGIVRVEGRCESRLPA